MPRRVTFDRAYRGLRNKLRRFDPHQFVQLSLSELQSPAPDKVEDLRRAPWQLLLLVKWICQDRMAGTQSKRLLTAQALYNVRQELWQLPDALIEEDKDSRPVKLFIRRLLYAQLNFQRGLTRSFVRDAALLASTSQTDPLRSLFESTSGLTPEEFIDLSFATYAQIEQGKPSIPDGYYEPLRGEYGEEKIEAFRQFVSLDFDQLRTFVQSLPDSRSKTRSEIYEFPVVSLYPFFRTQRSMQCWHPSVFFRGIESKVHWTLSPHGERYTLPFSKVFESHVLAQVAPCCDEFISEDEMKFLLPQGAKTPDGLARFGSANVFIEAKSGIFAESVMTVGHNEIYAHKTRAIRTAVNQAWEACEALKESERFMETDQSTDWFLLVVTNRELAAGGGNALSDIYPTDTLTPPTSKSLSILPLPHIYVVSIDDYERMMAATRKGEMDFAGFLRSCVAKDREPSTARMFMFQHLDESEIPLLTSDLVRNAFEGSTDRLEAILSPSRRS